MTAATTIGRDFAVRANPSYRLERWESLPKTARAQLSTAVVAMDGVSVLVGTAGSALPAKLVDDGGAKLFVRLSRPGPAPVEVSGDQLVGLVLDAVLEVEWDDEWVSGPLAYEALLGSGDLPEPTDRLSRLSYQAVARAERMPLRHEDDLCARLYGFGRLPVSRRWTRRYPCPEAAAALLDLAAVDRDWVIGFGDRSHVDWLTFSRRGGKAGVRVSDLTYKVYVIRTSTRCPRCSLTSSARWPRTAPHTSRSVPEPRGCCVPTRSWSTWLAQSSWASTHKLWRWRWRAYALTVCRSRPS